RQQHELALAARDHGIGPRRKMRDAELVEHPRRHHPVSCRWPAEEITVRGAAHQHYGIDGEGECRHMYLRHIGDEPCPLTDGNGRETKVAAATIAMRNGPVASPSARASSSGNDITLSRQRSAISTVVPRATGPVSGSRSEIVVAARLPSSQNVMAGNWL